jgi:hypothetical protein
MPAEAQLPAFPVPQPCRQPAYVCESLELQIHSRPYHSERMLRPGVLLKARVVSEHTSVKGPGGLQPDSLHTWHALPCHVDHAEHQQGQEGQQHDPSHVSRVKLCRSPAKCQANLLTCTVMTL